jgi:hypothetical protein
MKKFGILPLIALFTLAIAGISFAAGGLPQTPGKVPITIQNVKNIAPTASASACGTITGTKPTQSITTTAYTAVEAIAYDITAGAAKVVKWFEDGTLVWVGSSYTLTNNKGTTIAATVMKPYSTATATSTGFCYRRQ